MRSARKALSVITATALLSACAGTPVPLGSRVNDVVPTGEARTISAEACGFQLLLLLPLGVNDRMARAYGSLKNQAGDAFITDVKVEERWTYGFVGTSYCTALQAKAVQAK